MDNVVAYAFSYEEKEINVFESEGELWLFVSDIDQIFKVSKFIPKLPLEYQLCVDLNGQQDLAISQIGLNYLAVLGNSYTGQQFSRWVNSHVSPTFLNKDNGAMSNCETLLNVDEYYSNAENDYTESAIYKAQVVLDLKESDVSERLKNRLLERIEEELVAEDQQEEYSEEFSWFKEVSTYIATTPLNKDISFLPSKLLELGYDRVNNDSYKKLKAFLANALYTVSEEELLQSAKKDLDLSDYYKTSPALDNMIKAFFS